MYTNLEFCERKSINNNGCDEFKGLFTSKCPEHHEKILRFICSPVCPDGYSDNGSYCYKPGRISLPNRINITYNDLFI